MRLRARPKAEKKVVSLRRLAQRVRRWRLSGLRVIHCHGVFDLLHLGHIRHLRQARSRGDVLVVTVTPDAYVFKGPGRPVFSQSQRAECLAALECVAAVAVNETSTAVEAIRLLRPYAYVKGPDYRDARRDATGGILREARAARAVGARVLFTTGRTFSSTRLLSGRFLRAARRP